MISQLEPDLLSRVQEKGGAIAFISRKPLAWPCQLPQVTEVEYVLSA